MFTHKQVWSAIDTIAERYGFSASGLAKKAGLDPTSFNPSKRFGPDDRPRWPTMESINRVLDAAGAPVEEFAELLIGRKGQAPRRRQIPLLGLARAGKGGYFDDSGFPSGNGWEEIDVPGVSDLNAYALEITGDSMQPVYREGDTIVVSPSATIRKGDRVVVKTSDGQVMAKVMQRQTAKTVELASFNPDHPVRTLDTKDLDWMARIIWASQ
ncbi:MAG: helix-turn-helix transcriptional regulator [Rhizobiales bacterium]|nr:helix-turn-helix transcriptional regulator [Hyphomicrobiales bacterium]MBI3673590.1 helix-turn-helix transcriptional regulator [Hyphomicrobiales bacterium]